MTESNRGDHFSRLSSPLILVGSGVLLIVIGGMLSAPSVSSSDFSENRVLGTLALTLGGLLCGSGLSILFLKRSLSKQLGSTASLLGEVATSGKDNRGKIAAPKFFSDALSPLLGMIRAQQILLKERKEAFLGLESRHKMLTDNIAAAVVLRDARDQITYCSPYTEVLTGYATREILAFEGDFFSSLVPEGDRERYQRAFKIGALGDAFQVRHRLIHHSGIEMWVETRTVPILDTRGDLVQSLSVTIDVTGAVRYQRQVEEKNRDLHDFAYMVSHDLKGPLATVKGMLNVLEEDLSGAFPNAAIPEDAKATLTHIHNATQRLDQLVAGVLEYSKISAQGEHSESVELNSVLKEVQHHLSSQLDSPSSATSSPENTTKPSISIADGFPKVVGEHVWLYQVFSNLLGNAIKYRDRTRPLKVTVNPRILPSGRELEVAIEDNGLGIPADKVDHIFRPFQRAHGRSIEGTGIGLASARRMLEKCGGSVRVESVEGKGSTFFVTLRIAS